MNDDERTEPGAHIPGAQVQVRRKGDDIAERLVNLAAAVLKLLPRLLAQAGTANIVKQLERWAPAGGSNYEEARGAESHADFVHKIGVALKEVRETRYWLVVSERAGFLGPNDVTGLIAEAGEIIAILTASAKTARRTGGR